ncbi:DUF6456 domain-containing protein [Sulfitobacter delicatus]|uniref:DUF6456 domain-containing protein n=1 Tax=Sulfitobacter delicatus TaxID=218672 RepID=UPI000B856DED|nr:DUF6456 domain-containing protein [Sulfitobacter delicatus]
MPGWVPDGALHYLAHTEAGAPIRALARQAGCHASTIMRQIRRIETRRDDPLVDAALRRLGALRPGCQKTAVPKAGKAAMMTKTSPRLPDEKTFAFEALRVLRRLRETGAVLAVAEGMEKAVVVRETESGPGARTAVVDAAVAQAMALKDWIAPGPAGRVTRYRITNAGRGALRRLAEEQGTPERAGGFAEDQAGFAGLDAGWGGTAEEVEPARGRNRYHLSDSPLTALARRRDKSGAPFLDDALVHAGEQLREDFELAQMGAQVGQNWDHFLTPGASTPARGGNSGAMAAAEARKRVADAMAELGPGLSDVVLRCCCYLEGLETTEKRLGWSARSGKIVLRIALMRLKRHYDETVGPGGPMIG